MVSGNINWLHSFYKPNQINCRHLPGVKTVVGCLLKSNPKWLVSPADWHDRFPYTHLLLVWRWELIADRWPGKTPLLDPSFLSPVSKGHVSMQGYDRRPKLGEQKTPNNSSETSVTIFYPKKISLGRMTKLPFPNTTFFSIHITMTVPGHQSILCMRANRQYGCMS